MGCAAEVLSLAELRASQARRVLRDDLHKRFDCWRDELEADLPATDVTLSQLSEAIWFHCQSLTGRIAQTKADHQHTAAYHRSSLSCAGCERELTARPAVSRTVGTLIGDLDIKRACFDCRYCRQGDRIMIPLNLRR